MSPRRCGDDIEFAADRAIHAIGLALGVIGAAVAFALAWRSEGGTTLLAIILYGTGLVTMLGCSAAYNLAPQSRRRDLLRRFDHAAIFIMIAATYSPFTLGHVQGAWSLWLAAGVWSIAILGAVAKIAFPDRFERLAVVAYLALGWCIVAAIEPMLAAFGLKTMVLIAAGGAAYSIGVAFYLWEGLRFHKAIWHGLVLSAAALHYAAVYINI